MRFLTVHDHAHFSKPLVQRMEHRWWQRGVPPCAEVAVAERDREIEARHHLQALGHSRLSRRIARIIMLAATAEAINLVAESPHRIVDRRRAGAELLHRGGAAASEQQERGSGRTEESHVF